MKAKFIIVFVLTCLIGNTIQHMTLMVPSYLQVYAYAVMVLPGTFFHESAHYLTALVLGGSPLGFSLIPSADGTLGSVMIRPNWYNAAPVGFAPLMLVPFALFLVAMATRAKGLLATLVISYLAACAWAACTPSMQDISVAFSHASSLPFGIALVITSGVVTYKLGNFLLRKGI